MLKKNARLYAALRTKLYKLFKEFFKDVHTFHVNLILLVFQSTIMGKIYESVYLRFS